MAIVVITTLLYCKCSATLAKSCRGTDFSYFPPQWWVYYHRGITKIDIVKTTEEKKSKQGTRTFPREKKTGFPLAMQLDRTIIVETRIVVLIICNNSWLEVNKLNWVTNGKVYRV